MVKIQRAFFLATTLMVAAPSLALARDVAIRVNRILPGFQSIDLSRAIPIDAGTCGLLVSGVSAQVRSLDARRDGSLDLMFDGLAVDRNRVRGGLRTGLQNLYLTPRFPQQLCREVGRIGLENSNGARLRIETVVVHLED